METLSQAEKTPSRDLFSKFFNNLTKDGTIDFRDIKSLNQLIKNFSTLNGKSHSNDRDLPYKNTLESIRDFISNNILTKEVLKNGVSVRSGEQARLFLNLLREVRVVNLHQNIVYPDKNDNNPYTISVDEGYITVHNMKYGVALGNLGYNDGEYNQKPGGYDADLARLNKTYNTDRQGVIDGVKYQANAERMNRMNALVNGILHEAGIESSYLPEGVDSKFLIEGKTITLSQYFSFDQMPSYELLSRNKLAIIQQLKERLNILEAKQKEKIAHMLGVSGSEVDGKLGIIKTFLEELQTKHYPTLTNGYPQSNLRFDPNDLYFGSTDGGSQYSAAILDIQSGDTSVSIDLPFNVLKGAKTYNEVYSSLELMFRICPDFISSMKHASIPEFQKALDLIISLNNEASKKNKVINDSVESITKMNFGDIEAFVEGDKVLFRKKGMDYAPAFFTIPKYDYSAGDGKLHLSDSDNLKYLVPPNNKSQLQILIGKVMNKYK